MTTVSPNPVTTDTFVSTPPPAMRLRELVFGAACAAAVRAAARLGVADALGDAPATAEQLATAVDSDARSLRRLLRTLSCYGIFVETEDGTFAHTDMSLMLRDDDPNSLRYIALWCTEPWTWDAWPRLDEAVRSGGSVFHELYGKGFFEYLHQDAHESAHVFNRAMTTSSRQSALEVAELLDLTGISVVADIGGGQGHVLASLLEKHPAVRGTLLDLPDVVAKADPRLREGVRSRTGSVLSQGTAARTSRSRPISTSSRTSWSGTTRAPAELWGTSSRRRGRGHGSWSSRTSWTTLPR